MNPTSELPTFDLFISYASADARQRCGRSWFYLIRELKSALESHRHPEDGRRFRVCTFDEDFELSNSLPVTIRKEIEDARGMVVVCGSGARIGAHVSLEVSHGATLQGLEFVLLAAHLDEKAHDIWPLLFDADYLGPDLFKPELNSVCAWRDRVGFESHKLVARIWYLPINDVHDRHETQRRDSRRRILVGISTATALLASVGTAGILAWHNGQLQEASRLGQTAQFAAQLPCFDPRGLADGIEGLTLVPQWRGGAPAIASYALYAVLDRARRELMMPCGEVLAAAGLARFRQLAAET